MTGGTLSVSGVLGGAAVISSGATLNFTGSTDRTYAGNASGLGAITKSGNSILTLTGTNSAASLSILSGRVVANSANALGAMNLTLASGTTLQAATSGTSSGTMTLSGGATLQVDSGITLTRSAATALSGGQTLTKTGAGTLEFNTYSTGGFNSSSLVINEGTVRFNQSRFSGSIGLSAITVNAGATLVNNIAHALGGAGGTATPSITVNGGTFTLSTENYLNGTITLNGATINGANELRSDYTLSVIVNGGTSNWSAGLAMYNANTAFTVDSGSQLNLSGLIRENSTRGISLAGGGSLVLSGNNTYTGGTTISAGTLTASSVAAAGGIGSIGTGALTLTGGTFKYTGTGTESTSRTLNINTGSAGIEVTNAGGNLTFSSTAGAITSSFTKSGAGTLTLAEDLVLGSGGLTVNGGTLNVNGSGTYTGGLTLAGTINYGNYTSGGSGAITLTGDGTIGFTTAGATAEHTTLSGTGNFTKSGAGNLSLSGDNTLVGNLAVDGGTVSLAGAGSLGNTGTVSVGASGTLSIGASVSDSQTGTLTNAGTVTNAGTTARAFVNNSSLTNSGTISGTVNNTLTLANSGTLSGAVTNSGTFTNTGTVSGNVANSLTLTNSGTISGTVTNTGTFTNTGTLSGAVSSSSAFTSIGRTVAAVTTTGGTLNLSGTAGAVSVAATTFNVASNTTTGSLAATSLTLSGTGSILEFDLADPTNSSFYDRISVSGALDLSGLTGAVTLKLFSLDRIAGSRTAAATSFNPYSSFVLDLITFGSVTGDDGSGNILDNLGYTPAFVLDDSAFLLRNETHSGTFALNYTAGAYQLVYTAVVPTSEIFLSSAGTLADSANGPTFLSDLIIGDPQGQKVQLLRKTGSGALTITEALDHIGGTEITAGSIILSAGETSTGALGTGAVALSAGTTLEVAVATTLANNFSGSGTLLKTAAGDVTLTGTVGLAGTIQVSAGKLLGKFAGLAGTLQIDNGATAEFTDLTGSTFTGTLTGSGTALLNASGKTLNIGSSGNSFSGTFSVADGTLVLAASNALNSATIDVATGATAEVNGSGITLGGTFTGTGAFRKTGAGTVTFNGTVANTLAASVDAGTLRGDFTTSIGDVTVASGATLEFANSSTTSRSGANITGDGAFEKTGSGKLTLTSALGVTGGTTVSGGTLSSADFGTASTVTVNSGGVAELNLGTSGTLATVFAGQGTFTKTGNSTLTVDSTGLSTFAGKLRITQGTVATSALANLGTTPLVVVDDSIQLDGGTLAVTATGQTLSAFRGITLGAAGGTIDLSSLTTSGTLTVNSAITGSGNLTLKGAGNLTATGGGNSSMGIVLASTASDFTGTVTVTSGLVSYTSNASFGNAANELVLDGGGILLDTSARGLSRSIQVGAAGGTIRGFASTTNTLSGALSGSGVLNRTDAGTATFTGDLSGFSGTLNNLSSTVSVFSGASAGMGAATVNVTAGTVAFDAGRTGSSTINLDGGTLRFDTTGTYAPTAVNLVSGKAGTISVDTGLTATLSSGINGSAASFTKSGSGTLVLGGSGTATLSGSLGLAGTLQLNGQSISAASLTVSNATLRVTSGSLTSSASQSFIGTGTLTVDGGTVNLAGLRTGEGASTTSTINLSSGTLNITGSLNAQGDGRFNSFLLSHWGSTTNVNISGGTLNSLAAYLYQTWDGNSYITQSGGTVNLIGIAASGRTPTASYTLSGGRLNLGVGGFSASTNKTFTAGAATIGAYADSTSSTAVTLSDAATGTTFNTLDSVDGTTGRTVTWSGAVSGSGKLIKAGAGTLKLSVANSLTGNVDITGGTLELSGSGSLGSGSYAGAISNAGAFIHSSSATQTFSGAFSGAGSITKSGSGTLTLTGTNSLTGAISVTGGTLGFSSTGLGSTSGITVGTATLQWASGNTQDISSLVTLTGGQTATFDTNGNNVTLANAIGNSSTSSFAKVGSGTLTLATTNTFTGGLNANGGVLSVSDVNDTSSSSVGGFSSAANSYIAIKGGTLQYTGSGNQTTSRYLWVNQGAGTFDITQSTGSLTFTSTAGDLTGYAVTKTGAGTLEIQDVIQGAASISVTAGTLSLTATNTYTAGTTLTGGTLRAGSAGAIGAAGAAISLNGGGLLLATDTVLTSKAVTLGGNSTITLDRATSGAGLTTTFSTLTSTSGDRTLSFVKGANVTDAASKLVFNGQVSLSGRTTTLDVGSDVTVELSGGAVSGAQTINMVKSGAGTLIISGDSFGTWDAGNTTLSAGTLELRGLMGDNSAYRAGVTSAANTTLRLARDANFAFLSTLAVNGNTTIEVGRITSGTTSMAHSLSTLSIGASTLTVSRASSITGSGTGGLTFTGATTLTGNATLSVGANATLTLSGAVGGSGFGLTKTGNGTLTLGAASTFSGDLAGNAGVLNVGASVLSANTIAANNGGVVNLTANNFFTFDHTTAAANARSMSASNGGSLVFSSSTEARLGNINLSGGTFTSNRGVASYDILLANTSTGAATVTVSGNAVSYMNGTGGLHLLGTQNFNVGDVTSSQAADLVVSLQLANSGTQGGNAAGGINKTGAGTMSLTNAANSFTGDITIGAGTLEVAGAGRLNAGSYAGTITNNGALNIATSADQTLSGVIGGSGSLTKSGNGTLTLSNANTYSGATAANGGILRLTRGDAIDAASAVTIGASGTLRLDYALTGDTTISRSFNGSGTLDLATTGYTTVLSGLSSFTGSVKLSTGSIFDATTSGWTGGIVFAGGSLFGGLSGYTGEVNVTNGATLNVADGLPANLTLSQGGTLDFTGVTNSNITIQFAGGSLSNAAGFTGNVNVVGENVVVGANSLGGGTLVLGSGSSVNVTGAIGNAVTVSGGSIQGGNNVTGNITVSSGSFTIGAPSGTVGIDQLNANATVQVGGGTLNLNGAAVGNAITFNSGSITNGANFAGTLNIQAATNGSGVVAGTGTLTNAGGSTLGGTIVVNDTGVLRNNGTVTGEVTVESGGTLSGSGAFTAVTVQQGGILSPGNSPGVQTYTGSLTLNAGSIWVQQIFSDEAVISSGENSGLRGYDTIVLTGDELGNASLDLTGATSLNPITLRLVTLSTWSSSTGGVPAAGNLDFARDGLGDWIPKDFVIATYTGNAILSGGENITSVFAFDTTDFYFATGPRATADSFQLLEITNESGLTELTLRVVPEPSTYGILLGGLALAAAAIRRRRAKRA